MTWTVVALAGMIVVVGAMIQGAVGFGLNLVSSPLLMLIDPVFVPVPVLMVATVLAGGLMLRELGHVEWRGVGWAMLGRVPGNLLGLLALVTLPVAGFGLVIGVSVLAAVGLSVVTWRPKLDAPSLVVAGTASGAFGTVSALGGPPIALLYQNQSGPKVRATLSAFFLIASITSLITLAAAGQVRQEHMLATAVLLPFIALGYGLSYFTTKLVSGARLRAAVLVLAGTSAVVLIARSLLT